MKMLSSEDSMTKSCVKETRPCVYTDGNTCVVACMYDTDCDFISATSMWDTKFSKNKNMCNPCVLWYGLHQSYCSVTKFWDASCTLWLLNRTWHAR